MTSTNDSRDTVILLRMTSTNDSPDTVILLWTIEFGSKNQILRLLDEEKADLSATNENGDTVLHLLFRNKSFAETDVLELLKIFLDRGLLDPNIENQLGERVLQAAVANRMKSVVEVLISYGADVDETDEEGNSIAHFFVEDEKSKFLKINVRSSRVEKMEDESASFVVMLIEKGVDFHRENKKNQSAMRLTVNYNLQHILVEVLKHTQLVNVEDQYNKSLLHLFLEKSFFSRYPNYGHPPRYASTIVKLLLEKGVSAVAPDKFDETPLRMSIEKQDTSIIEMMIDHHLKSNESGSATVVFFELLKSCAWWGESCNYFLKIIGDLVAKGTDVNAKDKNGRTPLYHAFHGASRLAADFLADRGADFAALSDRGDNLCHALARKDPRVKFDDSTLENLLELLASKNCCHLNVKNSRDGETPLHLAAKTGNLAMARKLIEHGVKVDCKNKFKETPLALAVQRNQSEELVEFLLESGADVNSKDHRGHRPLLRAVDRARDHNAVVPILLKGGAYVNACTGNISALSTAIKFGCSSNAMEMLAYGADINCQSVVGILRNLSPDERSLKAGFVLQHWLKLTAAGLPCAEEYGTFAEYQSGNLKDSNILKEMETLKSTFIDDRTSIYDYLHRGVGSRRVYMYNEELKKIVDIQNLEKHFPEYKDVILACYRETILWKSMLEPVKRALFKLTNIQLPYECCELIFTYLRNQDLLNVIDCD